MNELFSPIENEILKLFNRRKSSLSIIEITDKIYGDSKHRPFKANNNIGCAIRRINAKCDYHELPWFLNGMGQGRSGKVIWKDVRYR